MGLLIAQQIVEQQHRGVLTVQSRPEGGTSAILKIYAPVDAETDSMVDRRQPLLLLGPKGEPLDSLQEFLEGPAFQVLRLAPGSRQETAASWNQQKDCWLVLIDLDFPPAEACQAGDEWLSWLASMLRLHKRTRLVGYTSLPVADRFRSTLELDLDDVIPKNLDGEAKQARLRFQAWWTPKGPAGQRLNWAAASRNMASEPSVRRLVRQLLLRLSGGTPPGLHPAEFDLASCLLAAELSDLATAPTTLAWLSLYSGPSRPITILQQALESEEVENALPEATLVRVARHLSQRLTASPISEDAAVALRQSMPTGLPYGPQLVEAAIGLLKSYSASSQSFAGSWLQLS
jgi:hypothetical protein